jgi:AAA ATPase domain
MSQTRVPSPLISSITWRTRWRASRSRPLVTPGQYRSTRYVGTPVLLPSTRNVSAARGTLESPESVTFLRAGVAFFTVSWFSPGPGCVTSGWGWKVDLRPVGREAEIAEIWAFFSAASGAPAALVITGEAGVGKTIVWKHVVQAAGRSARVLSCQPTAAERPLAFSALDDLFGDAAGEVLPELPGPRRQAVEAALLRDPVPGPPPEVLTGAGRLLPERRALARGILDVLRILSASAPLMVAVDDTQWLDRPSAAVLQFCFRRLAGEPVSIVLTFRTGDPVPVG